MSGEGDRKFLRHYKSRKKNASTFGFVSGLDFYFSLLFAIFIEEKISGFIDKRKVE